jgi:hypothetical protein
MRRDVRRQVLQALRRAPLPIEQPYGHEQWIAGALVHGPVVFDGGNQIAVALTMADGRRHAWRSACRVGIAESEAWARAELRSAMLEWAGASLV